MNLRQLSAFVGIYEEGSFNRAARRLNATQSGLSMQIHNLEEMIGVRLFDRSARGVTPTFAGKRLYGRAVNILRQMDSAESEIRSLADGINGPLRVGLMPTFTRGLLAPVLSRFVEDYPNVEISVVEAYSAVLTDGVAAGELDFAVVPRALHRDGITSRYLGSDRELLICRPSARMRHLQPVALGDLPPLKLVLPAKGNARRDSFDAFAATRGLRIEAILDMDAMIATLEFVANSDWMTILPATICGNDLNGAQRTLHPITQPILTVDYAVIEPAKKALLPAASILLERLEAEYAASDRRWREIFAASGI